MGFVGYALILLGLTADLLALLDVFPQINASILLGAANGAVIFGMLLVKMRKKKG